MKYFEITLLVPNLRRMEVNKIFKPFSLRKNKFEFFSVFIITGFINLWSSFSPFRFGTFTKK